MGGGRNVEMLRERLDVVLRENLQGEALELYEELERLEPAEPRWPHRRGQLLQKLGSRIEAVNAYERAVGLYSQLGFAARAIAMAKVILEVDPRREDVLTRLRDAPLDSEAIDTPLEEAIAVDVEDLDISLAVVEDEVVEESSEGIDFESMFPSAVAPDAVTEVVPSPEASPAESNEANAYLSLAACPLFASLGQETLREISAAADLRRVESGARLLSAGEEAECLFVIGDGCAQLTVPGIDIEPETLDDGDVFGEACILDDISHRVDVEAHGPTVVLGIPKEVLDDLLDEHEDLETQLLDLYTRRAIAALLPTSRLFATLDGPMRREMAKLFVPRRSETGETIVASGQRADGLYILVAGSLLVRGESAVNNVTAPAVFGQSSLLSAQASDASISSMSDALLLRLPADHFAELAALYPTVLMTLTEMVGAAGLGDVWKE